MVDAATKEQAEEQPTLQKDDEEADTMKEDEEIAMDVDDEDIQVNEMTFKNSYFESMQCD